MSRTPGPWYVVGPPWAEDGTLVIAGSRDPHVGKPVASTDLTMLLSEEEDDDERDVIADAHLVAAAPDLLDALNAVATVVTSGLHISSESVVFAQVRLALAKAMGEGVAA